MKSSASAASGQSADAASAAAAEAAAPPAAAAAPSVWREVVDPANPTADPYYHNVATGEVSWELPEGAMLEVFAELPAPWTEVRNHLGWSICLERNHSCVLSEVKNTLHAVQCHLFCTENLNWFYFLK